ncbi:MAG: hypothetical protein ACJA1R_001625, partial [Flavobacteriales bacterium]
MKSLATGLPVFPVVYMAPLMSLFHDHRLLSTTLAALLLAACGDSNENTGDEPRTAVDDPIDITVGSTLRIDESAIIARANADGLAVRLPLERIVNQDLNVSAAVAILTLDGEEIAAADMQQTLSGAEMVHELVLQIPFADVPEGTREAGVLGGYVIHYEVQTERARLSGNRSLYEAYPKQDVSVVTSRELNVGGESWVRVLAEDSVTGAPLANAPVNISLAQDDTVTPVFSGSTDEFGVLAVPVQATDALLGAVELVVEIGDGAQTDTLRAPVTVARNERILLTTDKPVYQPGQRIHLRSLALSRPSLAPAADREIIFEVYDAEGNKVFREATETDEYGVASLDLPLATELNQGNWRIAATMDGSTTERTVRVERYVLPNFGVTVTTDRGYYGPGDTMLVDIDAQYFFGQPVGGGEVTVQPYTFDVGFNPLTPIQTTLDGAGIARIEVPIPSVLVGQPLEQGNAFVRLDVTVRDGAEQEETLTRNITVTNRDVLQSVIPASTLLPGQVNTFYVLTRSPVGRPIAATNEVRIGDDVYPFATNVLGFAEFLVDVPADITEFSFELATEDEDGRTAVTTQTFALGETGSALALVTDGSLYEVGDTLSLDVVTAASVPRAFLDVVRDGQTLLTSVIELNGGRGVYDLDLSPDLAGPLQLHAYFVTSDADIVRGTRLVYVEGGGELNIEYITDRDEYRPGEDATLEIRITDNDGEGVAAAVGLTIVDEAVFALQDMRPGLERVYFELEEALLQPKYNVYGWTMENVLASGELDDVERATAASVVLAATDVPGYGTVTNSLAPANTAARSIAQTWFTQDASRVQISLIESSQAGDFDESTWSDVEAMQGVLASQPRLADAWGQRYRLELIVAETQGMGTGVSVASGGLDEKWGTADDLTRVYGRYELTYQEWWGDVREDRFDGEGPPNAGGGDVDQGGMDPNVPEANEDDDADGAGGSDAPRVRQFFPETLLVAPDIITDGDGNFSVTFPVADSITTWRMTGLASSAQGAIGSGTAGLRVFQPFFVDIEFPAELTQNDTVGVPVALFNYLETDQTVELRVDLDESGDWFTLNSDPVVSVDLAPGEVTVRYFEVQVDRVGTHPFQVTAIGSELSDAVRRVIRVAPDGQEQLVVASDRLSGTVTIPVAIPDEAIDEASTILVKLYPGLFAQVLEGLDSLLRVPSGCFEQTSSTTYPNILVLDYLQRTETGSPELELRATELIAQGYQRLLSYEVTGGGFEWFGNDPAHRILSSYGLLEFTDMARVFPVDPAVITRTQNWILATQEADGRFRAASEGIHEGATNNFQDSDLRATAYLTYALLESGVDTPATDSALTWVTGELGSDIEDPYTLGMAANMYLAADGSSSEARALIDRLEALKQTDDSGDGSAFFWASGTQSMYYSSGDAMNMESTALILQAYIRAGAYPETVAGVVSWLVQNKDQFGNFGSTQATILTLRAFIELL